METRSRGAVLCGMAVATGTNPVWTDDRPDPFVGRRDELAALRRWSRRAWDGDVVVASIVGESGVGKSTLLERLVPDWLDDGATVHVATCDERVSIPYLPVLTAMSAAPSTDHDAVIDVSPANDRLPHVFVTLADQLIEEASSGRVVLRVDDIHWADAGTLDLLLHMVVNALRRSSTDPLTLLVVLTSQPVDDTTEAHQFLARLEREPGHRSARLEPFDELAVNELLERLLGRRVSRALLEEIFDSSIGNPLVIRSIVATLRERDALSVVNGEIRSSIPVAAEGSVLDTPHRRRIETLDESARELLTLAAHSRDGTAASTLARIARFDGATMDAALDALEQAALLVELPGGRVRFVDPAVRQHLAGSLPRRAREQLHLRVAEALALTVSDDDDPAVLEVAHHLRRTGERAPSDMVTRFATLAVRQSSAMGAWAKAARYADLAVAAARRSSHPVDMLDLHLTAALAHFRNHDAEAIAGHCAEAATIARRRGDENAHGRALLLAGRGRLTLTTDIGADASAYDDLVDFAEHARDVDTGVLARCWALLAEVLMTAGDSDSARRAAAEGTTLALASGDAVLIAETEFSAGLTEFGDMCPVAAIHHFETSVAAAREGGDEWILAWPHGRLVLSSLLVGDLRRAQEEATGTQALCRRTHHWAEDGLVTAGAAAVALQRGALDDARQLANDALQIHTRSSFPYIPSLAWPIICHSHALALERSLAQRALEEWAASGVRGSARFGLLVDALTLSPAELFDCVDLERYRRQPRNSSHVFNAGGLAVDVEIGVRLGAHDLVEHALAQLDDLAERGTRLLLPTGMSVDRLRGMARLALGDVQVGFEHFDHAIELLDRAGAAVESFWVETERSRARLQADPHGTRADAERLAVELRGAGLAALHARLVSDAPVAIDEGSSVRRTVVCWDIVESTPLLIASGDARYVELLRDLEAMIERRLDQYGGVIFKHTGDGLFAWFADPTEAARCTRAVARDLVRRNRRSAGAPIVLRTGVAVGRPIPDQTDLFGVTVVTAARLCGVAGPGHILCTHEVAAELGPTATTELGPMTLKGLSEDTCVHEIAETSRR